MSGGHLLLAACPGYCQCGCGERAPVAQRTNSSMGLVKGAPQRFVLGHAQRAWRSSRPLVGDFPRDGSGEWVAVPGFPGYEVTRGGVVRSLRRRSPRVLVQRADAYGYLFVNTSFRKRVRLMVHRAVLLAFVGPRPQGQQARHLDGDKANNTVDNLAWGTPRENTHDQMRHGTRPQGTAHGRAKLSDDDVRQIRTLYAAGGITQLELAGRFGVSKRAVWQVVKRQNWTHIR